MQHFMFKFKQFAWIVAVAIALFSSSFASAAIWYVVSGGSNGNGQTESSPFNNLQSAFTAIATTGDTIRIAQGTYFPGTARSDSFVMSGKRANIHGG